MQVLQGSCRVQTVQRGHIRLRVRHRAQLVLLELPPLLAVQHAQLVLLGLTHLRLGRRAACRVLSDSQHYHLELRAGFALLVLTLLELGHSVYIALLGHTQISQDKLRVHIVQ